ncbi:hypothetical protein FOZ62_007281, partial [Perkinsus olseni]
DPDFRELSAEALNGMESPGLAPHLNIRVVVGVAVGHAFLKGGGQAAFYPEALKRDHLSKEFIAGSRSDDNDDDIDDNSTEFDAGLPVGMRMRHTTTGYADLGKKQGPRRSLCQDCPPVSLPVHIVGGQPLVAQSSLPEPLMKELADPAPEALVYLHGYNCKISSAMERLGQLMALGQFPLYIKPFIFSQSTGMALTYHWAMWSLPVFAGDLSDFVFELRKAGFLRVHFLVHSMGARLFCEALPEMERRS